jgi:hypothetical protein
MIMEAEVGMLIVETIAKIRRAFFVQDAAWVVSGISQANPEGMATPGFGIA